MMIRKRVNANAPTLARLAPACVLLFGPREIINGLKFPRKGRFLSHGKNWKATKIDICFPVLQLIWTQIDLIFAMIA